MDNINGVLFDLDGTLADTAPDLVNALNLSLIDRSISPRSIESLRYAASNGSLALVKAGVPELPEKQQLEIQQSLLLYYQQVNGEKASLFKGFEEFLLLLEQRNIPYGIVTNKQARFTRPLVKALMIDKKLKAIISGDSTLHPKPHTAPMLLAAQQINCKPENILYLGDAERDLIAAQNAGMVGAIALWGYLSEQDNPNNWPSDVQFKNVTDLHQAFLSKS